MLVANRKIVMVITQEDIDAHYLEGHKMTIVQRLN